MAKKMKTAFEPQLNITVTPRGVTRIGIPYSNLSEARAGRELQARCATLISLLSEVARGVASEIKPLAPAPPIEQLIQS